MKKLSMLRTIKEEPNTVEVMIFSFQLCWCPEALAEIPNRPVNWPQGVETTFDDDIDELFENLCTYIFIAIFRVGSRILTRLRAYQGIIDRL